MAVALNDIIKHFAQSTIQFTDLFMSRVKAGGSDGNRYTAPKVSGLVITVSGSATFSLNGVAYPLHKGHILHAGPHMLIQIEAANDIAWEYIVIHYETVRSVIDIEQQHFLIETGENHKIDYFAQQLVQLDQHPGDFLRLKTHVTFFQLLETMMACAKMQTTNNIVDQAIALFAENYTQPISIADIAERVGCERRRFAYLFDKQLGMSPVQYLTELRLKQAKKLLRTTTMPVSKVAEVVGYHDSFYFCRVFKKQYQLTPTEFRNLKY